MVSTLWIWLYVAWIAGEIVVAVATRTKRSSGIVKDRGSLLTLWIVIASSVTASLWVGRAMNPNIFRGAHWPRFWSLIALAAGLAIRWTAIVSLGKSFSANVAIRDAQTVHRTGLYRYVRHPSYLGLMLVFAAIGLYTRNWLGLAVALIPTTAVLLWRIHIEEAVLNEAFGEDYAAYSRTTKRLVPGIF